MHIVEVTGRMPPLESRRRAGQCEGERETFLRVRGGPEEHMVTEARGRETTITVQNAEDKRMRFANLWKSLTLPTSWGHIYKLSLFGGPY